MLFDCYVKHNIVIVMYIISPSMVVGSYHRCCFHSIETLPLVL